MIQNYIETDPQFVSELFKILDEMEDTLKLYLQKGQMNGMLDGVFCFFFVLLFQLNVSIRIEKDFI
jgi:hypothetical protein